MARPRPTPPASIERWLEHYLFHLILDCQGHLATLERLDQEKEQDPELFRRYPILYNFQFDQIFTLIAQLSKLFAKEGSSHYICFSKLFAKLTAPSMDFATLDAQLQANAKQLRIQKGHPLPYPLWTTKDEVIQGIRTLEDLIAAHDPFIETIIEQRDTVIAHTDPDRTKGFHPLPTATVKLMVHLAITVWTTLHKNLTQGYIAFYPVTGSAVDQLIKALHDLDRYGQHIRRSVVPAGFNDPA